MTFEQFHAVTRKAAALAIRRVPSLAPHSTDVYQASFLAALEAQGDWHGRGNLSDFLFQCAYNALMRQAWHKNSFGWGRRRGAEILGEGALRSPVVRPACIRRAEVQSVIRAANLTREEHLSVINCFWYGLLCREAARCLHVAEKRIYRRRQSALAKLRRAA